MILKCARSRILLEQRPGSAAGPLAMEGMVVVVVSP